jgi:hypothetical protein
MHWLYLLLAIGSFGLTMMAGVPGAMVILLLLLALGFLIAFVFGLMASSLDGHQRDSIQIISPDELRRMREMAQARKSGEAQDSDPA